MKTKLITLIMLISGVFVFLVGCGDDNGEDPKPKDELSAKIDESGISFITDTKSIDARRIKAGQSVTFNDASSGEPDSWEWTFEGGPSSSSEQNATVTWEDAVGQVMVILKVTRSSDEATDSDTLMLQVGPVEMLNRAVFGFEPGENSEVDVMSKWFSWTPNDGTIAVSMESAEGANNTSRSVKIVASSGFGEFQLRPHENGSEYLVSLNSETSYVFSFYIKSNVDFVLSEASVLNVRNDSPVEGWYTPFWSGDAAYGDINVSTSWTKHSFEFTTADLSTFGDEGYSDGTADNAGPFFKHFGTVAGDNLTVWIDEISLKEKEAE